LVTKTDAGAKKKEKPWKNAEGATGEIPVKKKGTEKS